MDLHEVSIKLDKDGHSYFNVDLWRKMSKCYELEADQCLIEVSVLSTFSMLVYYLAKSGYLF